MKLTIESSYAYKGKKHLRAYECVVPLYNLHYYIYIGKSIRDAALFAEKDWSGLDLQGELDGMLASAVEISHPDGGTGFIMLLSPEEDKVEDILSIAAHEALHLSWYVLDYVNIKVSRENHEAQAYLVESIFLNMKHALKDYSKRYKLKINL